MPLDPPAGVTVLTRPLGAAASAAERVLTRDALAFVAELERRFGARRRELLQRRHDRQRDIDAGVIPGFLVETRGVREGDWRVAPCPPALERRRVEITGPVDRKMMINALNSGADAFMADFEDALSPTWENVVEGQANVQDAVRGTLAFTGPDGRAYRLNAERATLLIRPRGWHLDEAHVLLDDAPVSASLFDFGMVVFHNATAQLERGAGPYFYLPKLESHLEARLWNDVFTFAEASLGIPRGSARATVLIETILAAFEMEEILYELRDHAAGLNAGRWDYIFSIIKKFSARADMLLPDRAQVTMAVPFMRAYTEQLVRACHKRGAHAIGGMAAFVPNRRDPAVTEAAVAKVREDKLREAAAGFDGTWVAHPDLVPVAMEVFRDRLGARPNQKDVLREDVRNDAFGLLRLEVPDGRVTDAGVRANVDVALLYLDAWLRGSGAVAIHNLMEDAATAEISRAQLWQWIRHRVTTTDGTALTPERYAAVRDEVLDTLERERGDAPSRLRDAAGLLDRLVLGSEFVEFLTLPAYPMLEQRIDAVAGGGSGAPPDDAARASRATDAAHVGFADQVQALSARWREAGAGAARRDYAPADVVRLRGSVRVHYTLAALGAERLRELLAQWPDARVTGVASEADAARLVGAGVDALLATSAAHARRLNDALRRADREEWSREAEQGSAPRRWLVPIVADVELRGDDPLEAFDATTSLIEAGAAGVVLDDRAAASSPGRFVRALSAARLAADVLDTPTVIVARTGASLGASIDDAIACGLAYAPYADVLWCDTPVPDLGAARAFADALHTRFPGKPLAYDCLATGDWREPLGALGYRWHVVAREREAAAGYRALVRGTLAMAGAESVADAALVDPSTAALLAALGGDGEGERPIPS
ncbi:malate synthase A [Gemmatirosa kalamazoonensis]|uniref:Isocitrate lyase n=1 Tax=Gemmatirosa kalamazoonensis TaxID=861299 RepID=W0RMA4_9BACT|nr:malate synthase A [Gemmatirosa kalamazoonensis]AHG90573.1 malate synthase A [Gemmatirosa kalamazoonensis]